MPVLGVIVNVPGYIPGGLALPGHAIGNLLSCGDVVDGGVYKVPGTVSVAGMPDIPVARPVWLLCPRRKVIVRETFSDKAGDYLFRNIRVGPWIVISRDHTGEYNAVIADNILAEPM